MSSIINVFEIKAIITVEDNSSFKVIEYIGVSPGTLMSDILKKFELRLCELNKKIVFNNIDITSFNLLLEKVYV